MSNSIEFRKGQFGVSAIIKTAWQDSFFKVLLDNKVEELELNDGKGWSGNEVNFLKALPNLKSLTIIDLSIKSIEAVHSLKQLQKLELSTYSKVPIDFNSFPDLLECAFEWINGSDSLFERSGIQKLFLNSYNKKNSNVFSNLVNLEELSILNSPIEDLQGLGSLKKIRMLRLANLKNVKTLHALGNLENLEDLEIQRCKAISSISEIFKLNKLKRLLLVDLGNIESIRGIENLEDLNIFLFYESTNIIDGDITPISKLKKLSKISFQNRKHYTNNREDFGNLYS